MQLLMTRETSEHDNVLTVVQTSYIVEEARAIITLQTFFNGEGAQCNSIMVHPETARVLAKVCNGIADEHDKFLERKKHKENKNEENDKEGR
jgi:hypothetical protein